MSSRKRTAPGKQAAARRRKPKREPLIGAHMSIAGGVASAIDRGLSVDCTAIQVFVKNNMQWFAKPLPETEVKSFLEHPRRGELKSIFGHAGYLINLAATNREFLARSLKSLQQELVRADQLQIPFLVLHPGSHMGKGVEAGLEIVVKGLDKVFKALPDAKARIALETTAGQGSCLGHEFGHLAAIRQRVREPNRLCFCFDTAHVFAAGYDISTRAGVRKTFRDFDETLGLESLVAVHCNDSKTELGSKVDRHEAIGRGAIGLEPFRYLMREPAFRDIPKVLETPKGKDLKEDVENLNTLRSLL